MSFDILKSLKFSGINPEDLSASEKRAADWHQNILENKNPDPLDEKISMVVLANARLPLVFGPKLNVMRVIFAQKIEMATDKNKIKTVKQANKLLLDHLILAEKGHFEKIEKYIRQVLNDNETPLEVLQASLLLPTLENGSKELSYQEALLSSDQTVNPSRLFEDRLELLKKAQAFFMALLNDLPEKPKIKSGRSAFNSILASWLEVEKCYQKIVTSGDPKAYFEIKAIMERFSADAFLEECEKLNPWIPEQKREQYRVAEQWILALSQGFFLSIQQEVNLSCAFIEAMKEKTQVHTKYFTPIDLLFQWWVKVYLESNYPGARDAKAQISAICQGLRSAGLGREGKNVLCLTLSGIPQYLQKIEKLGEVRYAEAPYNLMKKMYETGHFPRLLLHWLQAPLTHADVEYDAVKERALLSETEWLWTLRVRFLISVNGSPRNNSKEVDDYSCIGIMDDALSLEEKVCQVNAYFKRSLSHIEAIRLSQSMTDKANGFVGLVNYEDAQHVFLLPFIKIGKEMLEQGLKRPQKATPERVDAIFSEEAFWKSVGQRKISDEQKHHFTQLVLLLKERDFPIALYQQMARILESFCGEKGKMHSLKELSRVEDSCLSPFLVRLQSLLPHVPLCPPIAPEAIPNDLKLFCRVLQIPDIDVPSCPLPVKVEYTELAQIVKVFQEYKNKIRFDMEKRIPEMSNESFISLILGRNERLLAQPALYYDCQRLINKLKAGSINNGELAYLIMTTGAILEHAMKLLFLQDQLVEKTLDSGPVINRPFLHSHRLDCILERVEAKMPTLTSQERSAIIAFGDYTRWSRYPKQKGRNPLEHYVLNGMPQEERAEFITQIQTLLQVTEKIFTVLASGL